MCNGRFFSHLRFTLQGRILSLGIETGTTFTYVRQVAVAENVGLGVLPAQVFQQALQGDFLLGCAGVGRFAVGCQSALVADADGVLVVVAGVGAGEVLVARLVQLAVALYVVVVAGEAEAAVVAGDERGDGERPVLAGRRTVNND